MSVTRRRPLLHLTVSRAARAVVDSLPARTAAEAISRLIVGRAAELRRHAREVSEERAEHVPGITAEQMTADMVDVYTDLASAIDPGSIRALLKPSGEDFSE